MTTAIDPFERACQANQARIDREAAAASERASQAQADRTRLEKERQVQRYRENVQSFIRNYFEAVAEHAIRNNWAIPGIEAAREYCQGLVNQSSDMVELPNVSRDMKRVLHEIFARKILFYGDRLPAAPFLGQKMDWYPEVLQEVQKPRKTRSYRPQPPKISIPTPDQVMSATKPVTDDNVRELRPAITAKKKGRSASSKVG